VRRGVAWLLLLTIPALVFGAGFLCGALWAAWPQ
jgi:hypothetical protein